MMRQIYAWAKNARGGESPQKHVWRFAAAALIALVCLGVSLRTSSDSEPSGTKTELKAMVAAGKTLTFRVVRIDADGNVTPLELGGSILAPDDQDFQTTLKIITTDSKKNGDRQQVTASFTALSGEGYSKTVSLDEKWKFNTSGKGSSQLIAGNKERFELATRNDWLGKKTETLYVEVVGAPQKNGKPEKQ